MSKYYRKIWVAINPSDTVKTLDPQNASFYNSKAQAVKAWGNRQKIIPIYITEQNPLTKSKEQGKK